MKQLLPNLIVVVGFCLATVGAAGFHSPARSVTGASFAASGEPLAEQASSEAGAVGTFAGGLVLLIVGGVLLRRTKSSAGHEDGSVGARRVLDQLTAVRDEVERLERGAVDDAEILAAIEDLRSGTLFDLGAESEPLAARVGFDAYARVWSPFAVCERLLNRCWSMVADGHGDEGREELPLARAAIEEAVAEATKLA